MTNTKSAKSLSVRLREAQAGTTAVEYAVVAAGIALVVAAAVYALGSHISTQFYNTIVQALVG